MDRTHRAPDADAPRRERRAPEGRSYTIDQVLGRTPIRLRRRGDKVRLAVHVAATAGIVALTVWWVVPVHVFTGPVLFVFAPGHGVHVGDLPVLLLLLAAARSIRIAGALVQRLAS